MLSPAAQLVNYLNGLWRHEPADDLTAPQGPAAVTGAAVAPPTAAPPSQAVGHFAYNEQGIRYVSMCFGGPHCRDQAAHRRALAVPDPPNNCGFGAYLRS